MTRRAVIFGCAGTEINDDERRFFADIEPAGFILFARNCQTPDQIRMLPTSLRDSISWDQAPVLIDQEGGRVALEEGAEPLDVMPLLEPSLDVFYDFIHLTSRGSKTLADALHDMILKPGPKAL